MVLPLMHLYIFSIFAWKNAIYLEMFFYPSCIMQFKPACISPIMHSLYACNFKHRMQCIFQTMSLFYAYLLIVFNIYSDNVYACNSWDIFMHVSVSVWEISRLHVKTVYLTNTQKIRVESWKKLHAENENCMRTFWKTCPACPYFWSPDVLR